jgi:uncharacterized protein
VKGKPGRPPSPEAEAVVLSVRVQPRSSRNGVTVREDGSLRVSLTAPPVDNAANEALVRFLADSLGVSRSRIEIIAGQAAREKRVRISGMSGDEVRRVLNEAGK